MHLLLSARLGVASASDASTLAKIARDSDHIWSAVRSLATTTCLAPLMSVLSATPTHPAMVRLDHGVAETLAFRRDSAVWLAFRERGSWLTPMSDQMSAPMLMVRAVTPVTISTIPGERFLAIVSTHRQLAQSAMRLAVHEQELAVSRALRMSSCDVRARLLFVLAEFGRTQGKPAADGRLLISTPWTQQLLAEMIGTTPETLSRLLTSLQRQGIVHRQTPSTRGGLGCERGAERPRGVVQEGPIGTWQPLTPGGEA
jgi:CRP-like cAMP-binding protein